MSVLRFRAVSKCFHSDFLRRRREVLRSIDFDVERGETFAYLGHNGAGKTTSIKALLGLIRVDGGSIEVFDSAPGDKGALARTGYLPENPYFYEHLSGREFLRLVADLHGLDRRLGRSRVSEVLELVSMSAKADQRMRGYSKGMRQRIGLAQALMNDPEFLVLDEPMGGLDPMGRHHIRTIIAELKSRGKTIFLSSHILADVEAVADRAAILTEGTLRRIVDLRDRSLDGRGMEIHCRGMEVAATQSLREHGFSVDVDNETARVLVADRDHLADAIREVQQAGAYVLSVHPVRVDLESIFLSEVAAAGHETAIAHDSEAETREQVRRILDNLIDPASERVEVRS